VNALFTGRRKKENVMKTFTTILAAATATTALAADPTLSSTELDQARAYLQQTRSLAVGATRGLSDAQWKFKQSADRWSIVEIVEHMVLAQDLILGPVRQQLVQAPAPAAERDTRQIDSILVNQFPDRLVKFKAPEPLAPTGRVSAGAAMDRLLSNYAKLSELLEKDPDLRRHAVEAAPLKALSKGRYDSMDGYQWILAACGHVERHVKQILEVKADPNFPAK